VVQIHPTAIVDAAAKLGADVSIGPYCVVGPQVSLGSRVKLHSHVVVDGLTEIGEDTEIFPFSSIGHRPQDKKFRGEASRLVIGARNIIREYVTMNPGTEGGGLLTQVGDDCLFMASTHVAHDCLVGNHVILANNATLAGHVHVGDGAIIGGLSAVHQFVRIGAYAFIGGMSGVEKDVIPFGTVKGERASLDGLNLVGLKRRQVSREHIHALRHAFKALFHDRTGTLQERALRMQSDAEAPEVKALLEFVTQDTSRAFCTPDIAEGLESDAA
jgi:UDP-N-acetylglucosamine acyltransferase